MNKTIAIKAFGSGAALARAVGLTRSVISRWPDELDQSRADLVRGAAFRLSRKKNPEYPDVKDVLKA